MSQFSIDLRLISWNTKGMNKPIKICKVMARLQHLKGDIIFLQETHLRSSETSCIKRAWMSHMFHSKFSDRSRGAAVINSKNVMFEPSHTVLDTNGRYVIVTGSLQNTPVVLASIYAPNWDDEKFFLKFFAKLPNLDDHHLIIGGDFNLVLNTNLDRSHVGNSPSSKSVKTVLDYMSQLGISDPWRFRNSNSKAFSFFSHVHHTFSRIDFFLIDNKLQHQVSSCDYHTIAVSDHAPTSADIHFPTGKISLRPWNFPSQNLAD